MIIKRHFNSCMPYFAAVFLCIFSLLTFRAPAQELLNIDFSGLNWDQESLKSGPAAVGVGMDDFWNLYTRDSPDGWQDNGSLDNLSWANGDISPIGLNVYNAQGAWGNGSSDEMYHRYLYPLGGGPNIDIELENVPEGHYNIYLYGHGGPNTDNQNSIFSISHNGVYYGNFATVADNRWEQEEWEEGMQFVVFRNVVVSDSTLPIKITVAPGNSSYAIIAGLQLVTASPLILNFSFEDELTGWETTGSVEVLGPPRTPMNVGTDGTRAVALGTFDVSNSTLRSAGTIPVTPGAEYRVTFDMLASGLGSAGLIAETELRILDGSNDNVLSSSYFSATSPPSVHHGSEGFVPKRHSFVIPDGTTEIRLTFQDSSPQGGRGVDLLMDNVRITAITEEITLDEVSQLKFDPQTGLYQQALTITDLPVLSQSAVKVYVTNLPDNVQLYNASGFSNGLPYIEYDLSKNTSPELSLQLSYFNAAREIFLTPSFVVGINSGYESTSFSGTRFDVTRVFSTSIGQVVIEFNAVPGNTYAVEYSDNMTVWTAVSSVLTAAGNKVQWIDDGPPKTISRPADSGSRFYRIIELAE